MASSATDLALQVHRRRLRTVLHGLKFLQSVATKLDIWSFFPPANPGDTPYGRRHTYDRQRSLLDCIDSDSDEYFYEDALSSLSRASRVNPNGTAAATPTDEELASDERVDRFIVDFHRCLVNEKKVSLDLRKCKCFAATGAAAGSTPTPSTSTTYSCRTPISPDSYFNLEKQKAAGYIASHPPRRR